MEVIIMVGARGFQRVGELVWIDHLVRDEKAAEERELLRI